MFRPHGFGHATPSWIADWNGDGIIALIDCKKTASLLIQSSVPAIDILGDVVTDQIPIVIPDNDEIAKLAFEYFQNQGFKSFAVCGFRLGQRAQLDQRCDSFKRLVETAGLSCAHFSSIGGSRKKVAWESEQEQIASWIDSLPKPLGLLACNDTRGREVLAACQLRGISVPEEVAVLGVGNDELLCRLSDGRLSSIDVNPLQTGYQAAGQLDRLMQGIEIPKLTRIAPLRVVSRCSTDTLAVNDPELSRALQFIRRYACDRIQVIDVVEEVNVERRVLERRFQKHLGHSPKAEIIRIQLAKASELLAETSLTNTEVAYRCGFNNASYFMDLFHRKIGKTPGEFRRLCIDEN
nr:DNA-binding transcriptional regulator [Calycomorphotria hydatis]